MGPARPFRYPNIAKVELPEITLTPLELACVPVERPLQAPAGFRWRLDDRHLLQILPVESWPAGELRDAAFRIKVLPAETHPLAQLAAEARRVNVANGWGVFPTTLQTMLLIGLLHGEITAVQLAGSPERATEKLGNLIIRALDLVALLIPGFTDGHHWLALDHPEETACSADQILLDLHTQVGMADFHIRTGGTAEEGARPDMHSTGAALIGVVIRAWRFMRTLAPSAEPLDVLTGNVRQLALTGLRPAGGWL